MGVFVKVLLTEKTALSGCWPASEKKNPAYGRHRTSQPMRIVAPIFLFTLASKKGLKASFSPPSPPPPPAAAQGAFKQKKIYIYIQGRATHVMDIATFRLNWPRGPIR